jgi:hypothetical protein
MSATEQPIHGMTLPRRCYGGVQQFVDAYLRMVGE